MQLIQNNVMMKTHISLILVLLFSHFSFSATNFEKGNDAYAKELYSIAIQNYLEELANDNQSAELYYNLGNAYYKTNELGEAIWAYEQALKLDPSNKDYANNLSFVNNLTVDKLATQAKGIGTWLNKFLFQFPPNFWFYMSIVFSILTVISLYLFFTPSTHLINNISLFTSVVFGLLLIFSFTTSVLHQNRLTNTTKVVIIKPQAKILTAPKTESTTAFQLHEGAQLNLLSTHEDWLEISLNSKTGWIQKNEAWIY